MRSSHRTDPSAPAPTGSRGWTSAPAISGTYPRTSTTASAVTKTPSRSTRRPRGRRGLSRDQRPKSSRRFRETRIGRRSSPGLRAGPTPQIRQKLRARQPDTPAHLPELDLKAGRFFEDGAELDLAGGVCQGVPHEPCRKTQQMTSLRGACRFAKLLLNTSPLHVRWPARATT